MKKYLSAIFISGIFFLTGCSVLRVTGQAVGIAGKVVYTTAKVAGKTVITTANVVGKGVKTVVNMTTGKHVIQLEKIGSNLAADVLLNRKVRTDLIIDTGATDTVISADIARKLGIDYNRGKTVLCQLADGRSVSGRQVNIREIRIGGARVYNVNAVVLDSGDTGKDAGLLGMSFLENFIFKVDSEKGVLVLQKR
jgi:clan AA aspartic protease (TIGR02281 family)